MSKLKSKAGRKNIDPMKVKKNVAVYRQQKEIDENGGMDKLKEKINYLVDNMHPIKFNPNDPAGRTNIVTMQEFKVEEWTDEHIIGFYEHSSTEVKIPINIFETFFR